MLLGRYSLLTRAGRQARADLAATTVEVDRLGEAWRRACEGAGAAQRIDTVSGPTICTPRLTHVTLGPPLVLIVQLLPGQLAADLDALGYRIAPMLGGRTLRIDPRGPIHARVELVTADLLTDPVPYTPGHDQRAQLGRTEHGLDLAADWAALPHAVVQGATGSGKSWWLYAQLAHLAHRPHTLVAGCDPSGLLWRPWAGRPAGGLRISGLADVDAHAVMLERLVAEMDARIRRIPPDRDSIPVGHQAPLIVVVLEEYPGLLGAADSLDKKLGARIRAAVRRLLAESRKAGLRIVLVTQRADANTIGAFERGQCGWRLSFRVENADALRMLHPSAAAELVDEHMSAAPGVALLTAPGQALTRLRGPAIGGYAAYARLVAAT